MTRHIKKKSVGLTILLAVMVALALGLTDMIGENQAEILVHEFRELLEGVEAEILAIPDNTEPSVNTTDTMQTEKIQSQIAYLEAFDEVIQKQIL